MAPANAKDGDPQNAYANCCETHNTGEEEDEDQEQKDDVVDREDFGRLDQDPVDGLEYIDVGKYVPAVMLTYRVLCLVNTRDEHTGEDDQCKDDK